MNELNPRELTNSAMIIEIKTEDVCAKGRHPEDILSNLCHNDFCFDGVQCSCMEAFLQSLKYTDEKRQRAICFWGEDEEEHSTSDWQKSQSLWWKGRPINRQSRKYLRFIGKAYDAMFIWCNRFRTALMETEGKQLLCNSGKDDPHKAILTDQEFCKILTDLRESHKGQSLYYPRMWPNSFGVDEDYV